MKKFIAVVLAVIMLFSLSACRDGGSSGENANTKDTPDTQKTPVLDGVNSSLDILNAIWNSYESDEKFLATGGSFDKLIKDVPGEFDITDKASTVSQLVCPENAIAMVDEASSLFHAMNANNFTGAAYHVSDSFKASDFIGLIRAAIKTNQWICGTPEKMLIADIAENYVVVAFGSNELISVFSEKITSEYDFAVVEVDSIT